MRLFVPDWDDRVDPGYDFATERFSLRRDPYRDDQYGHEATPDRLYDGLLVSRMALDEGGPKRALIERAGIRRLLRLPDDCLAFGDCGAFGYRHLSYPPFEAAELVAYYDRLRFDLGASPDVVILPEHAAERSRRLEVTLRSAETFLAEYCRAPRDFTPVGSVQGWDVPSYVESAAATASMGYGYLALGGLARSRTPDVEAVITAVRAALPADVRLHVFGVARAALLPALLAAGVASVDSSSPLRQAWLSPTDNYWTLDRAYTALRIPIADQERTVRDTVVARAGATLATLREAEEQALAAVRAFDRGERTAPATLRALLAYDRLLAARRDRRPAGDHETRYRETLRDRPWRRCPCAICCELGVEVILFRGNNRNRRRGFHNMYVARQRLVRLGGDKAGGGGGGSRVRRTQPPTKPAARSATALTIPVDPTPDG